ncbi:MAG: ABC transporter ATP-binding protein [Chloroflexota bacterium]|nr:MAG: ABC transporter ATP-binding protein [Chloroflexota bacterium]
MSALRVTDLWTGYGSTDIVHGVSLEVPEGEVVTLLGRNGVGKTTLLKAILGVLPSRRGRTVIFDEDVTDWTPHRVARRGVAYVPQDAALFGELTVRENLELAQVAGRNGRNGRTAEERVFSLFPVLGKRLSQKAGTLSGGEQRMLNLGRAFMKDPRLLLIDEVTEGVQPSIVTQIGKAIEELRSRGASVLLVEQKVQFALALSSRFTVMQRGEVVEVGAVTSKTASLIEKYFVL